MGSGGGRRWRKSDAKTERGLGQRTRRAPRPRARRKNDNGSATLRNFYYDVRAARSNARDVALMSRANGSCMHIGGDIEIGELIPISRGRFTRQRLSATRPSLLLLPALPSLTLSRGRRKSSRQRTVGEPIDISSSSSSSFYLSLPPSSLFFVLFHHLGPSIVN